MKHNPNFHIIKRDFEEYEGALMYEGAATLDRYRELRDTHPDARALGVFWAFSDDQFNQGMRSIGVTDIKQIRRGPGGMYGTSEGIDRLFKAYDEINNIIKEDCDPAEVYAYEYNNHESAIAPEGDEEAIKLIVRIFGAEAARSIKRYSNFADLETIIKQYAIQ